MTQIMATLPFTTAPGFDVEYCKVLLSALAIRWRIADFEPFRDDAGTAQNPSTGAFRAALNPQIQAITIVVVLLYALFALSDIRARLRLLEERLKRGTE